MKKRLKFVGLRLRDMDGGGRCQQCGLGRLGSDRVCQCPFCTEGRIESKFGECSRCASASNREPSTSTTASGGSRLQGDLRASSGPVLRNLMAGEGDRSLQGPVSHWSFPKGQFRFFQSSEMAIRSLR